MLARVLEPEVMDSEADAREYDAMDHAAVNAIFVTDLLSSLDTRQIGPLRILDLGAGTAQIPIELCRRHPTTQVVAVDAAASMLAIAEKNIVAAGFSDRIEFVLIDAKKLPSELGSFPIVISNSILHHVPEPRSVISEAVRVTTPDGLLFHRDLARPNDEAELQHLVATYAAGATDYQRKLFADSLRAALTLDEMRELITNFGFAPETVRMTSDRHWTWVAIKN